MRLEDVEQFLRSVLAEFRSQIAEEHHSWKPVSIEFGEGKKASWRTSSKPDFEMLVARLRDDIPAIHEFAKLLTNDQDYQRCKSLILAMGGVAGFAVSDEKETARFLFTDYLSVCSSLVDNDTQTRAVASAFFECLSRRRATLIQYSVLRGVFGDVEQVELGDGVRIRRLSDGELCEFIERISTYFDDGIPLNRYVLEHESIYDFGDGDGLNNSPSRLFERYISALRFSGEGNVEFENVYSRAGRPGELNLGPGTLGKINRRHPPTQSYELTPEVVAATPQIDCLLNAGNLPQSYRVAADRFNKASVRDSADEKLIDAIISLEALFSEGPGSVAYKVGMRCAKFIEDTGSDRHAVFELIQDAYKRRGALVHGGRRKKDGGETDRVVADKVVGLVRASFRKVAQSYEPQLAVPKPKDFDEPLLMGNEDS